MANSESITFEAALRVAFSDTFRECMTDFIHQCEMNHISKGGLRPSIGLQTGIGILMSVSRSQDLALKYLDAVGNVEIDLNGDIEDQLDHHFDKHFESCPDSPIAHLEDDSYHHAAAIARLVEHVHEYTQHTELYKAVQRDPAFRVRVKEK